MIKQNVAILTGDFVKSSNVTPDLLDTAMQQLAQTAKDMAEWMRPADLRFTRFRGDGWQVCIEQPWLSLRAALVFLAILRAGGTKLTSRISIGVGPVVTLGTSNLSDGQGAAFETSGRGLDSMKSNDRISLNGTGMLPKDLIIASLLSELAVYWTPAQAEAAALYLHPDNPTLKEIAAKLGISEQAVSYRLKGAGTYKIRRALEEWEDLVEQESNGATP